MKQKIILLSILGIFALASFIPSTFAFSCTQKAAVVVTAWTCPQYTPVQGVTLKIHYDKTDLWSKTNASGIFIFHIPAWENFVVTFYYPKSYDLSIVNESFFTQGASKVINVGYLNCLPN